METNKPKIINPEDLKKLMKDVALIKEILFFNSNIKDPEGEISEWAKEELKKARKEKDTISHEELKKELGL